MATTKEQKRARLDALTTWCQSELDQLTATGTPAPAGSIQELTDRITTLAAVANPTAAQTVELRLTRLARADARRWVRVCRLALLLDGGRARDADVTGSDQ